MVADSADADGAIGGTVRAKLVAISAAIVANPTGVKHDGLLLAHAVTRADNGWQVFPLRGKTPAIANPHPRGSEQRKTCKGECGLDGHGIYDATTDTGKCCEWWTDRYRGSNIGGRVPEGVFVLDTDPRAPGHIEAHRKLVAEYGPLKDTLATLSGRCDGGMHRFYLHPGGKLSTARLGPGFDLKDSGGYVVLPPSIHPETGWPYLELDRTIVAPDDWLVDLMRSAPSPQPRARCAPAPALSGHFDSIADAYSSSATWPEVLEPHGWRCLDSGGDLDGSRWLHPAATSECSATIRNGCLFVYSTNTPFEPTSAGDRHGYTRFRAFAVLNHFGDLSAAARALRAGKVAP